MIMIKAHAGCEGTTDTSMASLIKAVETGADIVEVDIHRAKDGVFVVGHNDTIGKLMIAENTCQQLKEEYPETITLAEVLDYLADKKILLNIDYKVFDCYKEIADVIAECGFPFEQVILTGAATGDNMVNMRNWYPGSPVYFSAPEDIRMMTPYLYETFIDKCLSEAKADGCADININYICCSREFVARCHREGIAVHVWTVDEPEDILRMKEYGVDSITTHWVTKTRELCEPGKAE